MDYDIVGIVLKLNCVHVDLDHYLPEVRRCESFNIPKFSNKRDYKYVFGGQWLMLYDPKKQAITVIGKIKKLTDGGSDDFPCKACFDSATFRVYPRTKIPLSRIETVFGNFSTSRRYRNITRDQFAKLTNNRGSAIDNRAPRHSQSLRWHCSA